jgi:hypothetical protein
MNEIRIKPGITGILAIAVVILLAVLFTFYPDFFRLNKNNPDNDWPNWYGLLLLFIPFFIIAQFKSVTISDGKISILYYLSRKRITARMDMIGRVSFGTTKMSHGSIAHTRFYDKTVSIQFKDKQNTVVKIHGGFHSGLDAMEKFIKTNYPAVNW